MEAKRLEFDKDFDFDDLEARYCYFNDDRLEFIEFERYVGPITLQYLPNGGIQKEFINLIGEENLANQVLL